MHTHIYINTYSTYICTHIYTHIQQAYTLELSDYFDYIEHHDVFFTIVMLMLVCHNRDSYSGFKDP